MHVERARAAFARARDADNRRAPMKANRRAIGRAPIMDGRRRPFDVLLERCRSAST